MSRYKLLSLGSFCAITIVCTNQYSNHIVNNRWKQLRSNLESASELDAKSKAHYFPRKSIDSPLTDALTIPIRSDNPTPCVVVHGPIRHGKKSCILHNLHLLQRPIVHINLRKSTHRKQVGTDHSTDDDDDDGDNDANNAHISGSDEWIAVLYDSVNEPKWNRFYQSLLFKFINRDPLCDFAGFVTQQWIDAASRLPFANTHNIDKSDSSDESKSDSVIESEPPPIILFDGLYINELPKLDSDGYSGDNFDPILDRIFSVAHQLSQQPNLSTILCVGAYSPLFTTTAVDKYCNDAKKECKFVWMPALEDRRHCIAYLKHYILTHSHKKINAEIRAKQQKLDAKLLRESETNESKQLPLSESECECESESKSESEFEFELRETPKFVPIAGDEMAAMDSKMRSEMHSHMIYMHDIHSDQSKQAMHDLFHISAEFVSDVGVYNEKLHKMLYGHNDVLKECHLKECPKCESVETAAWDCVKIEIPIISDDNLHTIIDFCRTNIAELNACIEALLSDFDTYIDSNMTEQEAIARWHFNDAWKGVRQSRIDYYRNHSALLSQWKTIDFWKALYESEMKHLQITPTQPTELREPSIDGNHNTTANAVTVSSLFEDTATTWLVFDFFTQNVATTVNDLASEKFGGDTQILKRLHSIGVISEYDSSHTSPYELGLDSIVMPRCAPELVAFEAIFDDSHLSAIARRISNHYVFSRELKRARNDAIAAENHLRIVESTAANVESDPRIHSMNSEQRASLEIELLSQNRNAQTKLNEAVRRVTFFEWAMIENLRKTKLLFY